MLNIPERVAERAHFKWGKSVPYRLRSGNTSPEI
jgi:hypothetical protein